MGVWVSPEKLKSMFRWYIVTYKMGYHCEFILYDHRRVVASWYMSYNFYEFGKYWGWCPEKAHGHTPHTIMNQLEPILRFYEEQFKVSRDDPFQTPAGEDAWTTSPQIYYNNLRQLWEICQSLDTEYVFFKCDDCTKSGGVPFNGIEAHIFSDDEDDT